MVTKICFCVTINTHQSIRSNYKVRNYKSFLKQHTIRNNQRVIRRPNKHLEVDNYVSKNVNNRWEMGIPITLDILQTKVLCYVKSHDQELNYNFFFRFIIKITKKL